VSIAKFTAQMLSLTYMNADLDDTAVISILLKLGFKKKQKKALEHEKRVQVPLSLAEHIFAGKI